jgi:hypothetical protein
MTPIPRIFEGQSVAIVAGGPSLRGFDWERLRGVPAIAINRAYEMMPFAPVLWWSDSRFWRQHKAALERHAAIWKATCFTNYLEEDAVPSWVTQYRMTETAGFDPDPRYLRSGNNSAFAAICLAAHLGAARLVLLGVDMRHGPAGETHYHGGHGLPHSEDTLTTFMLPFFETLAAPLAALGIEVINASPDSALTVWPRCSIEEGLQCLDISRRVSCCA